MGQCDTLKEEEEENPQRTFQTLVLSSFEVMDNTPKHIMYR